MADRLSPERRSALMKMVPTRNTTPELAVRRILSKLGYRYRLHRRDLPGTPDLVLASRRKVIFVNGCFWHSHPNCSKGRPPKSRSDYWVPKLKANQDRDTRNILTLQSFGWEVLVVWQCETKDAVSLGTKLETFVAETHTATVRGKLR